MTSLPSGTVTFLFTDIEGSVRRWEADRVAMEAAMARHNAILERAIGTHNGHVFHTAGDAYGASFAHAADAVAAAIDAQRALNAALWDEISPGYEPLLVRMGIHTGLVTLKDGDYVGITLNRAHRLMAAGRGGQILVSQATQQLVRDALPDGARLVDLGRYRLRDLEHADHLFRLIAPGMLDVDAPPETAEKLGAEERVVLDGALEDAPCPYRGLAAFREEDAAFFFGREVFTTRLSDAVSAKPMVGVIGPSGSGKSSVVFAGLLPGLHAGTRPAGKAEVVRPRSAQKRNAGPANGNAGRPTQGWTVLTFRPGSEPFHALAGALLPLLEGDLLETDRLIQTRKLAAALADSTLTVRHILARVRDKRDDVERLLLVADQFEELYTLCPDEGSQRRFQDLLFDAVHADKVHEGSLKLTLTLRADFMGHALAYRPFADAIQDHNVILGPMNHDELMRAIAKPAELQGRAFEAGLVERIAEDVGEKAGTLPLLEFALTKLWDEQEGGWLTHDAYERIGRVEGAVARHADAVYERLGEAERDGARRVFVQLVQPGEGTEDTRRIATHDELGGQAWDLVRKLADARLIVTNRDESGRETAEVVHEALIRSWGRLKEWMNGDRRFRAWQERLRFALRQWEATGHDEGALLRGAPLAEAEGWLTDRRGELSEAEGGFVEAGVALRDKEAAEREALRQHELEAAERLADVERERAEAEGRRAEAEALRAEEQSAAALKLRQRAVLLGAALVAAGALALAAIDFAQQARDNAQLALKASLLASARELAAAASANFEQDPELSTLLALHAVSSSRAAGGTVVPEAQQALHLALQHTRGRLVINAHPGSIYEVGYSPDGLRLVSCGDDGIRVWDSNTGHQLVAITGPVTKVATVAFSPDGTLIASGGPDGVVRLWDSRTGQVRYALEGHTGQVNRLSFSPDGSRLATASGDKSIIVWNVHSGSAEVRLIGHTDEVNSVAWSPDGARLASGSYYDGFVRLWNSADGSPSQVISTGLGIRDVAFNRRGNRLALAGNGVRIWNLQAAELDNLLRGQQGNVSAVAFLTRTLSAEQDLLVTASSDKSILLWDKLTNWNAHVAMQLAGHRGWVRDVAISPDNEHSATASDDGTIRIWDISPAQAWRVLRGHLDWSPNVAFDPAGKHLGTANLDGTARIWRVDTATAVLTFTGHTSSVYGIAYSPDGKKVATSSYDGSAKLWRADTGALLHSFEGHSDRVTSVGFSPDGSQLVTSSKDKSALVWTVQSGLKLLTLTGHEKWVNRASFSPDGRNIVTGSDDMTAMIWNAETGRALRTLVGHTGYVSRVDYSPSGDRILTASDADITARIWDAASGKELFKLADHSGQIKGAQFSPDGKLVATSSWDGTVKLWDANTGEEKMTVADTGLQLRGLAFGPDGTRLAVGSQGGALIFTLRLDELIAMAHSRLTRDLTLAECRAYLHLDYCPPSP